MPRLIAITVRTAVALMAAILACALLIVTVAGCAPATTSGPTVSAVSAEAGAGDAVFAKALADHTSGLEVEGEGTVQKVLSDDSSGDRHQRFIVELASGQTLLITHNIDVAPRVEGVRAGDRVTFKGEYVWNAQGGLVHWTHRDPDGGHVDGWIKAGGKTYE
jgi:hypothetical protein